MYMYIINRIHHQPQPVVFHIWPPSTASFTQDIHGFSTFPLFKIRAMHIMLMKPQVLDDLIETPLANG